MKTKRGTMGTYSFALAALALVAVILCNLLFGTLPLSFLQKDLTQNDTFTLDEQTKSILSSLKEEVNVYLVAQEGQEDQTILQLLKRYQELNPLVKVGTVDPVVNPTFLPENTDLSLNENSLIVKSAKRTKAVDYTEIYTITSQEYLEYYYTYGQYIPDTFSGKSALTSAINYVSTDVLPVVGILEGHGEQELSSILVQQLRNDNLVVESTTLLRTGIPEKCKLILINAPTTDLNEAELAMLRGFLEEGNRIFLLTNPQEEVLPNLSALCKDFGIQAQTGTVEETDSANYYANASAYYIFPSMESHEITDPLLNANYTPLLAMAHGISYEETEGVTHSLLLESSNSSKVTLSSEGEEEKKELQGPFAMGILAEKTNGACLLYVSSASLVDETVNALSNNANRSLFLNACDWMAGKTDTIAIRGSSLVSEYLTVSQQDATFWTSMFCVVIPLGILAIGTGVWLKRRNR